MAELLAKAEAADAAEVPDGMSIPEELARRGRQPHHPGRAFIPALSEGVAGLWRVSTERNMSQKQFALLTV